MKVIKQYLLSVYEDGTIFTEEILSPELTKGSEIKETVVATRSWDQYNLISYPKKSELYKEIQKIQEDYISIEFLGRSFQGKIDRSIARVYGLKDLMNFSRIEQVNFKEGQSVSLEFDKVSKILKIKQI
jgi:hypothetical protein